MCIVANFEHTQQFQTTQCIKFIHCVAWNCTTGTIVNIGQNLSKEELGTVEERGSGREVEEEDFWEGYLIFLSKARVQIIKIQI